MYEKVGGGVLREFMVDQRDTLQYMVYPCIAPKTSSTGVRHNKSKPYSNRCFVMEEWTECESCIALQRGEISQRAELNHYSTALSTDRCCIDDSIFHLH